MKNKNIFYLLGTFLLMLLFLASCIGSDTETLARPTRTRRPTPTHYPTSTGFATPIRSITRTPAPIITLVPTSTGFATPIRSITRTPTATVMLIPTYTSTFTPTDTPTPTSVPAVDINVSLFPVPISIIPDKLLFSEKMRPFDVVLIKAYEAQEFLNFPNQLERSLMWNINNDGYPDNLETATFSILEIAREYNVTSLAYNLEWPFHSLDEKVARIKAVKEELDKQGNTLPLVLGPTFGDFWNNYAAYAPYVNGYAVQLQRVDIGTEGILARESIVKANSVLVNPIMFFQISSQAAGEFARTKEQIITIVNELAGLDGVSSIQLYYVKAEWWWLCEAALNELVP